MRSAKTHRHAVRIACCLVLLACRSDGHEVAMADEQDLMVEPEPTLRLDLSHRSLVQTVEPAAAAEEQKLVEIEIPEVVNPKRIRLTFEVHYQPEDGDRVLLGTFALFPPDNPGKFLVATRGEVRAGGSLELSMQVLDEVGPEDVVRVDVRPMSLRRE
jgi:hypothetical protein